MEKDANYFAVGLFVTVTFLALIGFVIWLAGGRAFKDFDRYTVLFTDRVICLEKDALVKYKGIQVGKVLDMRLSEDRADVIKVDIEVDEATPVRAETSANVELAGITGICYIDLATDSFEGQPPLEVAGEQYPVLKGTGSPLVKFFDDLPQVSESLLRTLTSINELSRGGTRTLESIRNVADKLSEDPSQILRPPSREGVEIPR